MNEKAPPFLVVFSLLKLLVFIKAVLTATAEDGNYGKQIYALIKQLFLSYVK